ncbi:hypothetical protein TYRP_013667 [Tyrophagus putrescentiae]|nr:hypothetical protein TYRP_013667 [Tyrophagus putrescentiae]
MSVNGSLRNSPPQSVSHRATAANALNFNVHQRYFNSLHEAAATRTDLEDNQRYSKSPAKKRFVHTTLKIITLLPPFCGGNKEKPQR